MKCQNAPKFKVVLRYKHTPTKPKDVVVRALTATLLLDGKDSCRVPHQHIHICLTGVFCCGRCVAMAVAVALAGCRTGDPISFWLRCQEVLQVMLLRTYESAKNNAKHLQ